VLVFLYARRRQFLAAAVPRSFQLQLIPKSTGIRGCGSSAAAEFGCDAACRAWPGSGLAGDGNDYGGSSIAPGSAAEPSWAPRSGYSKHAG
jgi:hypothetical protein